MTKKKKEKVLRSKKCNERLSKRIENEIVRVLSKKVLLNFFGVQILTKYSQKLNAFASKCCSEKNIEVY